MSFLRKNIVRRSFSVLRVFKVFNNSKSESPSFLFYLVCLIGVLALLSSTMAKNPTLSLFASHLGSEDWQLGIIAAIGPIPGILLSFPAGAVADRWGKMRVIQLSLFFFAAAPFLYLVVSESWQLIPVRFFHGIATAIFGPIVLSLIISYYPINRASRMSFYSSLTMVGRVIAPALAGFLITIGSFIAVYLTCAVSGIVAFSLGLTLPRERELPGDERASFRSGLIDLKRLLTNKGIIITSTVEAMIFFASGAFETFLPVQMEAFGWDPFTIGLIMAFQISAIIFIKPLSGAFSDRWKRKPFVSLGLIASAFSFIVLASFPENFPAYLFGSIFFGTGVALTTSSTAALVSDFSLEDEVASSIGMLSSIMDIGHSLGPFITGFLISFTGFFTAYISICTLLVLTVFVFLFMVVPPPKEAV
ncbi:MAG: MFS transporter [Candidatus Thorarchaeota archaeon]